LAGEATTDDQDIKFLHGCSQWGLLSAEYSTQETNHPVTDGHK